MQPDFPAHCLYNALRLNPTQMIEAHANGKHTDHSEAFWAWTAAPLRDRATPRPNPLPPQFIWRRDCPRFCFADQPKPCLPVPQARHEFDLSPALLWYTHDVFLSYPAPRSKCIAAVVAITFKAS